MDNEHFVSGSIVVILSSTLAYFTALDGGNPIPIAIGALVGVGVWINGATRTIVKAIEENEEK